MEKSHYLLSGLVAIIALAGFSNTAHAQWAGNDMSCNPSGGGTVEVGNVTPATGSNSAKDFSVNVGCRSWNVIDPANNITSGGYCIGIPVVGAETVARRRAYLNGQVGGPYIEFQFVYHASGAPYIGAGDGSGGWGAVGYGESSGASVTRPTPGSGFTLGSNNETLSVVVPAGQNTTSLVAGDYLSEPHTMRLWSGTSPTHDIGYLNDEKSWENCQTTFPGSAPQDFGPLVVKITIEQSCSVSVAAKELIYFGEFMSPTVVAGSVPMQSGQITVECTTASPYIIKLDGGMVSGDVQNRAMRFGGPRGAASAPTIRYQLYHSPGASNVWGDTTADAHVENPGFLGRKSFTVNAVIPAQPAPVATGGLFPTGDYSDEIKVTLSPYP